MEYNIGGKIFLKKGGKYVPKMLTGGDEMLANRSSSGLGILDNNTDAGMGDWQNEATSGKSTKNSPSVYGMGLDFAATTLNSLARKPQPGTSARASAMSKSYTDDNTINSFGSGLIGTAAMLDPTGTMKVVDSAMKLGRGAKNLINPGDEYGISKNAGAEVVGNIIDPLGRLQQSANIGKKHGFGEALKDFATFGVSGNNLMKKDVYNAMARDKEDDMRMRQGMNQGAYRNDSVYAKLGARIKPKYNNENEPNVEIESGEIVLGNPTQIGIRGNTSTSLESKYGAMFHGDKHGTDSDGDGMEGIPLNSGEAYVASDYLGVNGKRSGSNNKSVASEMKPYLKFLNGGETNPTDPYRNNPVAIAETNRQLGLIKKEAERNKFIEELNKKTKSKDRNLTDILSFITENAPIEDMNPEEQLQVEQVHNQLNNQNQQQEMNYNNMMKMGGYYMQQGGMTEPEQNPSQDRMSQLIAETPAIQQGQGGQLSPEAQQILQQLPPEVQQQIMALPPDQQEAAIMQAAQSMGGGQPQGPETQASPEQMAAAEEMAMGATPEMGAVPEVGMEGGQPMMKCGGRMYRKGDYIRFQRGGRIQEGYIYNINPSTGGFSLG